jgi:hypothetical protein
MVGDMEKILTPLSQKALMQELQHLLEHTLKMLGEDVISNVDELFFKIYALDKRCLKIELCLVVYSLIDAIIDAKEHEFDYLFNLPKLDLKYLYAISLLKDLTNVLKANDIITFEDVYNHSIYKIISNKIL